MRPVSVTVGSSSDDLAIEACFKRTILSDLGKEGGQDVVIPSNEIVDSVDQRDDGALESLRISSADRGIEHSTLNQIEEGVREADSNISREEPEPMSSGSNRSQSYDNFIEAEYEMILEDEVESSKQEKPFRQPGKSCMKTDFVTDEEEEENVVVWCADTASSESLDSATEGIYPIEEEGPVDDANRLLDQDKLNQYMDDSANVSLSLSLHLITELATESQESSFMPSVECQIKEKLPEDGDCSAKTPTLSALINQQKWHEVLERVNEFVHVTDIDMCTADQVSFLGHDSLGDSFLHEICRNQPPVDVIRLWLQTNQDAVKKSGFGGQLPLHCACAFGASLEVIDLLVEACPESLTTPTENDKKLPLHFACRQKAKVEVLDFLLETNPEAIFAEDIHGLTPMDYAAGLHDPDARRQALKSIQNALQNQLSTLSSLLDLSKITILEEQERVKDLLRQARAEKAAKEKEALEDNSLLEYTLGRVATLEKSDTEQKNMIESLNLKTKTLESQLAETRQQLSSEKTRFYERRTRELESMLKIEECKNSALEQSLVARQEMVDNEKERTKDAEHKFSEMRILLQNEKLKTKRLEEAVNIEKGKWRRLEEELAKDNDEIVQTRSQTPFERIDSPADAANVAESAKGIEIDRIRSVSELKLQADREAIRALELGNARKQELIDAQQEKVEALERSMREKELLLQKSQETMKALEESIERKLSLQKAEEDKIRQLENLRQKKREMIDSEEEQVRKLDYLLGRKQALLELEQMKEKILKQTIAQKQALLETEMTRTKQLEAIHAEKEAIFASEQNLVKAIQASKKEKEGLLRTELELINKLHNVNSEKETLLKKKQKIEEDIAKKVRAAEAMLAAEQKLHDDAAKVSSEKEALLRSADQAIKDIETRTSKKSALIVKEQHIAESLEHFRQRRYAVLSQGRLYSLVDTTLCISHLVREVLLAKKVETRLIEKQKPNAGICMNNPVASNLDSFLGNAFTVKGKKYLHHFASFLRISPKSRKHTR